MIASLSVKATPTLPSPRLLVAPDMASGATRYYIGSLGKRPDEKDVKGVTIKNCTLKGTTNGARIKTYAASLPLQASGIVYEDIIMDHVKNPVIIDQHYNSKTMSEDGKASGVQISDVQFRDFTGTIVPPVVVNLDCNEAAPCQDIVLAEIVLTAVSEKPPLSSTCNNVKPTFSGNVTLGQSSCRRITHRLPFLNQVSSMTKFLYSIIPIAPTLTD
ncbi:hypothetical protein ACH5RR_020001 [Cinchona calisaya]|uniref:Polygalacturonase n=1 Tax=Cinchona calisaya TaxID=153742 RepID=A0ABD2ZH14_9GENT